MRLTRLFTGLKMNNIQHNVLLLEFLSAPFSVRVYVTIEFSYERGGICNVPYIAATVLNFGLAWLADVYAAQT